ncbi:unnamed protein product [Paramecium primaurelia]|uniref:Uncharacterized protein n=1 Tax=Paramecium primaurelia TaxID=5886 RepID=A0A8S1LFT4_PARPR|nr:unnamed protein product [Paramecium primaurelia]
MKKLNQRKNLGFEQFVLENFMVPRIEYVQSEQLQRVLIARMLLDLNEITNTLMNGKSIDKMKKYKLFYQKYQISNSVMDLWLKWAILKNKQLKQKSMKKQLYYFDQVILPQLSQFKNTLIRLKFLIFQAYQTYLMGEEQQSIHFLMNIKHEYYTMYNLKSFVTEMHLLNAQENVVYLSPKLIDSVKACANMPKEDFFQFIYFEIKLLYPISRGIAPSLAENLFNEIQILLQISQQFYKKPQQSIDQQLAKKYEQVFEMMDKYYEKLGKGLFKRKIFRFDQKPNHKVARSLISFLSSEENLKQSSTFKRDTHYESISSLYNAQQIQQIQLDLTKQSERVVKSTFHSRQASVSRPPSQFQPESILSKEMWLEVDNYKIKSFQKRKPLHQKPSVGKIYKNIITSVPMTKRQSKQEEFSPLRKQEIIQEVLDSKLTSKEPTKFMSQALSTPKPKISIMSLVVLFNLRYFHLESPGGKKLPKLITKHFLKILTYVDDPPYQIVSDRQLQIKELIKKTKRRSKFTKQNSFAIKPRLGLKSQFVQLKANFSERVRTNINKIKSLIRMGVFKKKRQQEKQQTVLGPVQSKPQSITNFLDFNRFKTAPDMVGNHIEKLANAQSQPTPRGEFDEKKDSQKDLIKGKGFGFFKAICLAKKLSLINYNTDDITYLQEKYGTLQQVKQQHLYYPTLKYKLLFQNKIQIWKIKYKDLTADKNFIVLYASQEGNSYNFYRFDLPVVSKGREKIGVTIWPTVAEALRELDKFKQYSQIFNFDLSNNIKKDKHSFISGLTQRAKVKITNEDINSCAYVQSYLCQFHQSQISKIKKICGYAYEILPNINYTTVKYINMNLINKIISYEYHIKRIEKINFHNKQLNIIDNITDKELQEYLVNKQKIKNSILLFRFICTSRQFMIDGGPSVNLKGYSQKIFSTVIKLSKDMYKSDFKKCFQKFVLLTLEIEISRDLKYHLNDLLSPEGKKSNSFNIPQVFGQQINKQYFELKVSSTLFNKEKAVDNIKSNLFIEPYSLQISLFHQLLEYIEKDPQQLQHIRFESLIHNLLFQSDYSNTQKELLSLFLFTYFDIDLIQNKVILKNDNQLKTKKMSLKLIQKEEKTIQLYAISPIEQQFVKHTKIINEKEQNLEQLFKISIVTQIQQYDDIYQGKQIIEEPDFMANNQEILQAINMIKQIPLYRIYEKGSLKQFSKIKQHLNYKINEFLIRDSKPPIYIQQSHYVNCQLPSAIKLKTLILSKHKDLTNHFNSNHYRFFINRNQQFIVHTSIYYSFNKKLDNFNFDQKGNERIYYFDGEMLYVNLQLELLSSRTSSFKMIFSHQDLIELFKINIEQYQSIYYFDDKFIQKMTMIILNNTYTERKFRYQLPTFLHRYFLSKKTRQTFIDYQRSISISGDSPKSPKGNVIQINNLNLLERHNNCQFVKLFYDSKEQVSKNYCETYLKEARVIGHFIKKFHVSVKNSQLCNLKNGPAEYGVVTVYSHLIIDVWIIQIYVPKTSRYLLGTINFLDLASLETQEMFTILFEQTKIQRKSVYLRKFTTNKLIMNKQQTFINLHKFFEFTRELNNSLNRRLILQQLLQNKSKTNNKQDKMRVELNVWTQLIKLLKLSLKDPFNIRIESEAQNKNYLEKSLIEQLEQDTNATVNSFKQIGKNYIQKKKNESMENQELLNHFKSLSSNYQALLKDKQVITIKSQFQDSSQICLDFGFKANLKEFIHKMQLKIDKIGLYTIQFFLDYMSLDIGRDNPFVAFESINYANSSMFNLSIRVLGFQSESPIFYCQKQINLREILNLFIADGYFKYQTNYMNAKLSLSDLKQICEYIGFKVKSQNFLGLANQQKYINNNPIFLEETKQEQENTDGMTFMAYKKSKLIILQLFQEHQKVHINYQQIRGKIEFRQTKMYFTEIEDQCPHFGFFVNNGLQKQALQRFMSTL